MHHHGTDIQGAMDWLIEFHARLAGAFLLIKDRIPSWGEVIDSQISQYVQGLGNWVRASDQWSFESHRYFGGKGLEIQKHRIVNLLPKVKSHGVEIHIPSDKLIAPSMSATSTLHAPPTHTKCDVPILSHSTSSGLLPMSLADSQRKGSYARQQIHLKLSSSGLSAIIPTTLPLAIFALLVIYFTIALSFVVDSYSNNNPWALAPTHCPCYK